MKDQVTIPDVREVLQMAKRVTPIMNTTELIKLVLFYSSVLERYEKEEYPDGLPEEVAE